MRSTIKLGVLTIFAVFIICLFNYGESYAIPREDFYDANGRLVASMHNAGGKPKLIEYKPKPAPKKTAPRPKSVVKKDAPKLKPKPVVMPKASPKKREYTNFDLDDAIGDAVVGAGIGAILAPFTGGTSVPAGTALGGAGGILTNSGKWVWKNKGRIIVDIEENCGKISKVEDPMGKSFPH